MTTDMTPQPYPLWVAEVDPVKLTYVIGRIIGWKPHQGTRFTYLPIAVFDNGTEGVRAVEPRRPLSIGTDLEALHEFASRTKQEIRKRREQDAAKPKSQPAPAQPQPEPVITRVETVEDLRAAWPQVLRNLPKGNSRLRAELNYATVLDWQDNTVTLLFEYSMHGNNFRERAGVLAATLAEQFGGTWQINVKTKEH